MKGFNLAGRTLPVAAAAAMAVGVFFGAAVAQKNLSGKPTAAVYVMGDPEDREIVKTAVFNSLVRSGRYNMVAIDAIDLLTKEHIRQEDKSSTIKIADYGKNAGAEWVCVVQITDRKGVTYINTRMIDVETKTAAASHMDKMQDSEDLLEFIEKQIYLTLASLKASAK